MLFSKSILAPPPLAFLPLVVHPSRCGACPVTIFSSDATQDLNFSHPAAGASCKQSGVSFGSQCSPGMTNIVTRVELGVTALRDALADLSPHLTTSTLVLALASRRSLALSPKNLNCAAIAHGVKKKKRNGKWDLLGPLLLR